MMQRIGKTARADEGQEASSHGRVGRTDTPLPPARLSRGGWIFGATIMVVALGAIIGNFLLPWLSFTVPQPNGGHTAMRDDLRDPDAVAYEQRLLVWPLIGHAIAAGVGILAMATVFMRGRAGRIAAALEAPALWALAYGGFLVALTGTRWLGFYWARLAEEQRTLVRLDAVPYLNLATGLALLASAAWLLSRRTHSSKGRGSLLAAGTAAGSLLLLPLVPFGQVGFPTGAVKLDGLTLAILGAQEDGFAAPEAVGLARLMLWACLYASVAGALAWHADAAAGLPKAWRWLRHAAAANIVFVLVGIGAVVAFYVHLPDLRPDTSVGPNPVLPLAWFVLAAVWWRQAKPGKAKGEKRS